MFIWPSVPPLIQILLNAVGAPVALLVVGRAPLYVPGAKGLATSMDVVQIWPAALCLPPSFLPPRSCLPSAYNCQIKLKKSPINLWSACVCLDCGGTNADTRRTRWRLPTKNLRAKNLHASHVVHISLSSAARTEQLFLLRVMLHPGYCHRFP